jgi:hypothetical protein
LPLTGGCGRKCRKPLRPKTKKTRPSRMRAIAGSLRVKEVIWLVLSGLKPL